MPRTRRATTEVKKAARNKKAAGKTKVPKKRAARRNATPAGRGTVKIRMYNVGFGDCFLVTLPTSDGLRRILFDCGSIKGGGPTMEQVLKQLWEDCTGADQVPTIDVVVATHRHKDHVSGFAKGGWEKVRVREVWMPWTEDPDDPKAKEIRDIQAGLALALEAALAVKLQAAPNDDQLQAQRELVSNALSNEAAMTTLHEGFLGAPKRRFFPEKEQTGLQVSSDALPGVGLFVLGPSKDKEVIRDMDPPVGKSYLRLAGSLRDADGPPRPFDIGWQVDGIPVLADGTPALVSSLTPADEQLIAGAGDLGSVVAVALDKAVNGTSLMLVVKVGATHMLFPGDAQWGTWLAALGNSSARALLRKTKFYKVGHHGSHNATPPDFVENTIEDGIVSMMSTHHVTTWPKIPKQELIDALDLKHTRLARSDKSDEANSATFLVQDDLFVEVDL